MVDVLLNEPAGLLLVAPSIVAWGQCSPGIVAIVRRFVAARPGEGHNEVLGMFLGAAGTFCAILVALAVFVVWAVPLTRSAQCWPWTGAREIPPGKEGAAEPKGAIPRCQTACSGWRSSTR